MLAKSKEEQKIGVGSPQRKSSLNRVSPGAKPVQRAAKCTQGRPAGLSARYPRLSPGPGYNPARSAACKLAQRKGAPRRPPLAETR
ncbi:hypothetical protein K466DRAFT_162751 [Polyporus arcularius HHB13444]|uniref:Uncharacterized protein n=1 Tax=Polyporus arcularius HHB13444 TaxID=1314778 RepID=A0A5C3P8Y4_9APHY|nr:hypothetical protein K466DRAFT_162751 [Polyporus arcularius HHB13444]